MNAFTYAVEFVTINGLHISEAFAFVAEARAERDRLKARPGVLSARVVLGN